MGIDNTSRDDIAVTYADNPTELEIQHTSWCDQAAHLVGLDWGFDPTSCVSPVIALVLDDGTEIRGHTWLDAGKAPETTLTLTNHRAELTLSPADLTALAEFAGKLAAHAAHARVPEQRGVLA